MHGVLVKIRNLKAALAFKSLFSNPEHKNTQNETNSSQNIIKNSKQKW